ncbi:hypothetical protein GF415_01585 [Candidatus Micrarchaeota archaeon]|nr:hypothetical protein [Candidatus Micrarchaeota archaeon]
MHQEFSYNTKYFPFQEKSSGSSEKYLREQKKLQEFIDKIKKGELRPLNNE